MNRFERVKLFQLSTQMAERDLDYVEARLSIDLQRKEKVDQDEEFYPQIDLSIRNEAAQMSKYYEVFYSLETSIRRLVRETLEEEHGDDWWSEPDIVPVSVREAVKQNMQREVDQAVNPRSSEEIDYTTFGQLGDMVRHRWQDFDQIIFNSQKGFNKVMSALNVLRGPIAHSSPLPPSEVVRLNTTVGDLFRLLV